MILKKIQIFLINVFLLDLKLNSLSWVFQSLSGLDKTKVAKKATKTDLSTWAYIAF